MCSRILLLLFVTPFFRCPFLAMIFSAGYIFLIRLLLLCWLHFSYSSPVYFKHKQDCLPVPGIIFCCLHYFLRSLLGRRVVCLPYAYLSILNTSKIGYSYHILLPELLSAEEATIFYKQSKIRIFCSIVEYSLLYFTDNLRKYWFVR